MDRYLMGENRETGQICRQTHTSAHTHARKHARTHARTHAHTHTHTHTHTLQERDRRKQEMRQKRDAFTPWEIIFATVIIFRMSSLKPGNLNSVFWPRDGIRQCEFTITTQRRQNGSPTDVFCRLLTRFTARKIKRGGGGASASSGNEQNKNEGWGKEDAKIRQPLSAIFSLFPRRVGVRTFLPRGLNS